MAQDIILHHYDTSPFSEKVRVLLGVKGLSWRSVIQPVIMPKPELVPLTGGYRRIPVMQIGADVYCDTQLILAELEARSPRPPVVKGADWAVNLWADRLFFQTTVAVVFGEIGDAVPAAFVADREKLSGRPFDIAAMKAAAPPMKALGTSISPKMIGTVALKNGRSAQRLMAQPAPSSVAPARSAISARITWVSQ